MRDVRSERRATTLSQHRIRVIAVAGSLLLRWLSRRRSSRAARRRGGSAPQRGGTLKLLGTSDIFNLDTVSAYYTVSNLLERAFTRQLVSYPNAPTFPELDQARAGHRDGVPTKGKAASARTARPTRSSCARACNGTRRPPRQVTAGDFVREFKMLCNPVSPIGAPGLLHEHDRRDEGLLRRLRQGQGHGVPAIAATSTPTRSRASSPRTARRWSSSSSAGAGLPEHPGHGLRLGAAGRVHEVRAGQRADPPAHALGRPVRDHEVRADERDSRSSATPPGTRSTDPLRKAYVDSITITEGLTRRERAAAARGGHRRHGVGHPAADPGSPRLIARTTNG